MKGNARRSTVADTCSEINGNGPLENPNNNPIIANADRTALFLGDWSAPALQTIQDVFWNNFMPQWVNSAAQKVLEQYGIYKGTINSAPVSLPLVGGPDSSTILDSTISRIIDERVANGTLPTDNLFSVYLPPGISFIEDMPGGQNVTSCQNLEDGKIWGYHYHTPSTNTPYTVVAFSCSLTNKNPYDFTENDIKYAINDMTKSGVHEEMEARANRNANLTDISNNAWVTPIPPGTVNGTSQEGADLCEGSCDISTLHTPHGDFEIQGFYSNAANACEPAPNSCISGDTVANCPANSSSAKGGIAGGILGVGVLATLIISAARYTQKHPESLANRVVRNNPVSKLIKGFGGNSQVENLESGSHSTPGAIMLTPTAEQNETAPEHSQETNISNNAITAAPLSSRTSRMGDRTSGIAQAGNNTISATKLHDIIEHAGPITPHVTLQGYGRGARL